MTAYIGSGGFAAVSPAVSFVTNEKYAVKVIFKTLLIERNRVARFDCEVIILSSVDSAYYMTFISF
jgi:serine/threonine protein kinase